jgi:YidC/Oxa1 family membrane protein insertase
MLRSRQDAARDAFRLPAAGSLSRASAIHFMDRKTVLGLVAAFALLLCWNWGVDKFFPPKKVPPRGPNTLASATNSSPDGTNAAVTNAALATTTNATSVTTNAPEQLVTLETEDSVYTFTTHGGGLKKIELKNFTESVRRKGTVSTNRVSLNEHGSVPILGSKSLGDNFFTVTKTPTNTVIAEKVLPTGLRVVKQFEVASNYTIRAKVWLQNTSTQTVSVDAQELEVGTAAPAGPEENVMMSGLFWSNGQKAEHVQDAWFDNSVACFYKRPRAEYDSGVNPVRWAAVHNQFFTLVVLPETNAIASQFKAHRIELPMPAGEKAKPKAFQGSILYPSTNLAANAFLTREFTVYAGPKQEKTLSKLGRGADAIMDFGFFSPISKLFLRAMNALHSFMPYGVAIIVITIIIKMFFWPLTAASTRSMKRMQSLSPELKAIQAKYKDDPVKVQKKTMELWKQHKVNPMSGCWPMLIQIPIFFALFRMIPNAIELRGTPFLWVGDLSRPDTLFYIPGLDVPFNLLPLIMGVTMFWQARLTPPSPGMDPSQQAIMKYMPLIFLVFLYNQPAGLTLYWTVQNLLTILQTKLTKAKEEAATKPAVVTPKRK